MKLLGINLIILTSFSFAQERTKKEKAVIKSNNIGGIILESEVQGVFVEHETNKFD